MVKRTITIVQNSCYGNEEASSFTPSLGMINNTLPCTRVGGEFRRDPWPCDCLLWYEGSRLLSLQCGALSEDNLRYRKEVETDTQYYLRLPYVPPPRGWLPKNLPLRWWAPYLCPRRGIQSRAGRHWRYRRPDQNAGGLWGLYSCTFIAYGIHSGISYSGIFRPGQNPLMA
jgi:hypothetical protein